MKSAISLLVLYLAIQVVAPFNLYDSMDDARSAIMAYYDPMYVSRPEVKLEVKSTPAPLPVIPKILPKVYPKITHERIVTHSLEREPVMKRKDMLIKRKDMLMKRKDMLMKRKDMLMKRKDRHTLSSLGSSGATLGTWVPKWKKGGLHSLKVRPRPVPAFKRLRPTQGATTKPRTTTKPRPTRLAKVKRVSLNKFAEAIEDIEKALADAQIVGRVRHNEQRLQKLRDLIKTAVEKRSYRFARKAIGEAMFTIRKINEHRKKSGRGKRGIPISSKDFLGSVRNKIGVSAFNDLFAMQGQVTLMFAIDDTGSMGEEMATAKKIATSIVNEERVEPVDYILSPFNDPGTGPMTYCGETETQRFLQAIDSLVPHDGGDCPELTFKGMIDAIDEGPYLDSPMYVFTDAGPKDATKENILHLQEIAQAQGVVVNFFMMRTSGCAKYADISSFHDIAQATTGQVFELKDQVELEKLEGLTAASLGGTAVVANAVHKQAKRKKRSTSSTSKFYSIPVDDSIDTLVVSMTADQPSAGGSMWSVSLTPPSGTIVGVTTNTLDQGTVYQISKPNVGIWNLGINADSNVNYDFFVKGSSADNIDFEFYFVRTTARRGVSRTIPITAPLLGGEAEAILTLGGVSKIDQKTLKAELITLEGDVIQSSKPASLTSKEKSGIRHSFKFFPPNQVFKIKLTGRTKKGNTFERISHHPIKAETLLVKVIFARNDYTMAQGNSGYVIFMIENFGNDEMVDIKAFGSLGTVERQSRKMGRVRKGRRTSFSVTFRGNSKATKGMTVTIVVSVKGRNSGSKAVMSVPLLVV